MNDILLTLKAYAPVRLEYAWGTITGAVGTTAGYIFGAWNSAIEALVITMIIDYISGIIAAYLNPDLTLSSQRGFRGILKKIMILMLVSLGHFLDNAVGTQVICMAVTFFFLGNEGLSVIENAAKAGLPIPNKLRQTLEQLTEEKKKSEENTK